MLPGLGALERIVGGLLGALPGVEMPRNVVDFLARRVTSSVRELEGALNRIAAYAMMTGREIDVAFVEPCEQFSSLLQKVSTKHIALLAANGGRDHSMRKATLHVFRE